MKRLRARISSFSPEQRAAFDQACAETSAHYCWREACEPPEEPGRYLILMRFSPEHGGDMVLVGDWHANRWMIPVPGQKPMGFAKPWYWSPIPPLPQLD
jgi:hypothetical protein